jgi:hypothetical protein
MAKRKKRRSRGPIAELGRGLRMMTPNRVLARFISGGKHQTFKGIARAGLGAQPGRPVPMRAVPWGSPLPTTKASAQRSRAAAKKQPANKVATKKTVAKKAVAKKTASGKVQIPKRNPDGTFDGSVSFPTFGAREQAMYERGLRGAVDPGQQLRQPRRRSS